MTDEWKKRQLYALPLGSITKQESPRALDRSPKSWHIVCLYDLILYVPSETFQL